MAYNVYVRCNECGEELECFTNQTISVTAFEKYGRRHGWIAKNPNWYCPECAAKCKGKTKQKFRAFPAKEELELIPIQEFITHRGK
ncbi:hypothetical protein SDC9_74204 [bioreactor metagenome]|uniref:Uncharacterized protein n=1 Tax=bioreactor metagenome TaxID=1076179 RepID=A0A644YIH7_9ZZZZ